jgi:hypothetical protein
MPIDRINLEPTRAVEKAKMSIHDFTNPRQWQSIKANAGSSLALSNPGLSAVSEQPLPQLVCKLNRAQVSDGVEIPRKSYLQHVSPQV